MRYIFPILGLVIAASAAYVSVSETKQRVAESLSEPSAPEIKNVRGGLLGDASLGPAPKFELMNQFGKPVTEADFSGHVTLINFFFASCQGPCPAFMARLVKLHEQLADIPNLQMISVTVDPKNDTPEKLRDYAIKIGANKDNWQLLTGPQQVITDLSQNGFHLGLDEMTLIHSTRVVLIDANKQIRGFFHGTDEKSLATLINTAHKISQ